MGLVIMRAIALAALAAACFLSTPTKADVRAAFGNTIVSHYPDGGWVKHWFEPDGSYAAHFSDGRRLAARWSVRGQKLCLTEMRPRMILPRFCTDLIEAEVGDTWSSRDPLGRRVRNVLVAGRQ